MGADTRLHLGSYSVAATRHPNAWIRSGGALTFDGKHARRRDRPARWHSNQALRDAAGLTPYPRRRARLPPRHLGRQDALTATTPGYASRPARARTRPPSTRHPARHARQASWLLHGCLLLVPGGLVRPSSHRVRRQHIDLRVGNSCPSKLPWWGNCLLAAVPPAGHHLTISVEQHGSDRPAACPKRLPRQLEGQLPDRWQRCCFVTRHAPILLCRGQLLAAGLRVGLMGAP